MSNYEYRVTVEGNQAHADTYGGSADDRFIFSQHKTEAAAKRGAATVRSYGFKDVRIEPIAEIEHDFDAYDMSGDDDLRDYSEERYNRDYCDYCGTTHDEGKHVDEPASDGWYRQAEREAELADAYGPNDV
uniref:Uncharacterized protein n=1 Tax=uncultured organism TaxID=155900 RepID=A0A7L9QBU0_9ZZZZ|nr:hypothetical protein [uncultured organism]